jgi:hypothetical protein
VVPKIPMPSARAYPRLIFRPTLRRLGHLLNLCLKGCEGLDEGFGEGLEFIVGEADSSPVLNAIIFVVTRLCLYYSQLCLSHSQALPGNEILRLKTGSTGGRASKITFLGRSQERENKRENESGRERKKLNFH